MSIHSLYRFLPFAAALAFAACTGDAAPSGGGAAAMAADTNIKPLVREPLTEADLEGIAMADLSVELPWTANRVSRDPEPAAGPAWLQSVETSGTTGFDRVTFTFAQLTAFPGYEIDIVEAGADIPCGEEGNPLSLQGDRALVIRVIPANAHDANGVRVRVRTRSISQDRFADGGLVCDDNNNVVWAAGLNSGDKLRVLELRNPKRLVVDIR